MRYEKNTTKLPDSAVDYLNYCRDIKELSIKSVDGYEIDLKIFINFLKIHKNKKGRNIKDVDIKKVELKDLNVFMSYLKNELGNNANTRCRKIATITAYFDYLQHIVRVINFNPTYGLQKPKQEKRQPIYLTLDESLELVQSIETNSYSNYERDYCIIVLLLNTGMRISELKSMRIDSIKGDILTIIGKGNKERTIYLNDLCLDAINQYLDVRKIDGDELFDIKVNEIRLIVKKYIERAKIQDSHKYTPHKLRHTSATLMYKYGNVDVGQLQGILGHKNINNTMIYTHVDDDKLREAVKSNPLNDILKKGEQ